MSYNEYVTRTLRGDYEPAVVDAPAVQGGGCQLACVPKEGGSTRAEASLGSLYTSYAQAVVDAHEWTDPPPVRFEATFALDGNAASYAIEALYMETGRTEPTYTSQAFDWHLVMDGFADSAEMSQYITGLVQNMTTHPQTFAPEDIKEIQV